jgi:hypothetical protein
MPFFESHNRIGFEYRREGLNWFLHDLFIGHAIESMLGRELFLLPPISDLRNLPRLHQRELVRILDAHGLGGLHAETLGDDLFRFEVVNVRERLRTVRMKQWP